MDFKEIAKIIHAERIVKTAYLKDLFTNNIAIQFKSNTEADKMAIFHKCSKEGYKYQVSFFDNAGAIMDFKRNSIDEVVEEITKRFLKFNRVDNCINFEYEVMEVLA